MLLITTQFATKDDSSQQCDHSLYLIHPDDLPPSPQIGPSANSYEVIQDTYGHRMDPFIYKTETRKSSFIGFSGISQFHYHYDSANTIQVEEKERLYLAASDPNKTICEVEDTGNTILVTVFFDHPNNNVISQFDESIYSSILECNIFFPKDVYTDAGIVHIVDTDFDIPGNIIVKSCIVDNTSIYVENDIETVVYKLYTRNNSECSLDDIQLNEHNIPSINTNFTLTSNGKSYILLAQKLD